MSWKFKQVVSGSSTRTQSAVIRTTAPAPETSLILPESTDLSTAEGLRKLNERFDQIERRLRAGNTYEVSLATKFGYGALTPLTATAQPVPGAKVTLDKLGAWLILCTFDWTGATGAEGFAVVDPEATTRAKRQDAYCRAAGSITTTAWCLFTATEIPRLVQLYAKGAGSLDEAGTSICAIWLGQWQPGDKRFGRQLESEYTTATDMNGDALTDHGEEARWPASDNPDHISEGVALPGI